MAGDGIGNVRMRGGWQHHQHKHIVLLMVMTRSEDTMKTSDQARAMEA